MLGLLYVNKDTGNKGKNVVEKETKKVSKRLGIYTGYVETKRKANLYKHEKNKYVKAGEVSKDALIQLDDRNHLKDEYYKLSDSAYFISYKDIKNHENDTVFDDSDKRYLVFNENVLTNETTELYTLDGNLKYTLLEGIDQPVYLKRNDMYYIRYMGELLGLKADRVVLRENMNTEQASAERIPVFMYHFFFDAEANEVGPDGNFTEIHTFRAQLQKVIDKGYQSITMQDLDLFLDGAIRLPHGSFVITMDDNAESVKRLAYPVLEELQIHATNFVITGWTNDFASLHTPYIELQSHSDGMHTGGCSGMQHGGLFNCLDYESALNDVIASKNKLSGAFVFCYPYGDVDENMKKVLRDGGYRLAFTTQYGYVCSGMDKLELPRVRITQSTSAEAFASLLEG